VRNHFKHWVELVDVQADIVDVLAAVEDFLLAQATYDRGEALAQGAHPIEPAVSGVGGQRQAMTTITMRYAKGVFLVTGKDIEARTFESRRVAKDWCADHYPGSPITEIGRSAAKPTKRADHDAA